MKLYIGTKLITAKPMSRAAYTTHRGWLLPSDEDGNDEGFLVEDLGGGESNHPEHSNYISWSPKAVFEDAYKSSGEMTIGMAIEALKQGFEVARSGWNGKDMFVYYVPANVYEATTNIMKELAGDNGLVPYNAYLAIKTAQGPVSTWVPSINDCLADDWCIVD
jgi:hypothetical protein